MRELLRGFGVSNVLGLAGAVLVVAAVAALAGMWWAVLAVGVVLLVMSYATSLEEHAPSPVPVRDRDRAASP